MRPALAQLSPAALLWWRWPPLWWPAPAHSPGAAGVITRAEAVRWVAQASESIRYAGGHGQHLAGPGR
ncbi:MAG: hypothetical protein IPK34_17185 [Ramlibacter sp.]|nr:hypothetical protein [Ramlibacter sp.]